MKKVKKEIELNHDTLVTFGDEALTFRKDDPRTQEHIDKKKQENLDKLKESGKDDLWAGISLSNTRQDDETFESYQDRRKTVKMLQKIYKTLGREKCKEQFPFGFGYAINVSMKDELEKNKPQPQMTAMMDGKEIPVIINNDKK